MANKRSAANAKPKSSANGKPKSNGKSKAKPAAGPVSKTIAKAPARARGAQRAAEKPTSPAPVRPVRTQTREEEEAEAALPRASAAREKEARGKYVYCVIHSDRPLQFGAVGMGSEPAEVHTVNYKDIAAVVSETPIEVHEPTRSNVLAHERVNETVMRNHTVIPMSFGTVFKTRDDIHELLRSAYDAFKDVLVKMEDKLEFGLKVLWDRDLILRELERENEDIRRLKGEISSQKGSTYFARMQYGRLVDAALQARSERYVAEIFDQLRGVSVASRANRPIGDRMIMNAAFLVRRDMEQDFDACVKSVGARNEMLTFKYTGPWPPYNFVNIRLKLERA
jgi:hypothetical protein